MTETDVQTLASEATAAEALEWSVRIGSDRPQRRWIVLSVAASVGLMAILVFGNVFLAVFGVLAILGSTHEILFPSRYRLDSRGARSRVGISVNEILWSNVRRVTSDEEGVKLSPLPVGSRLEPFRGVTLRFAGNRDEVMARIARKVGEDGTVLGTRTDG